MSSHYIQIKLLTETKPIVSLPWEILHYKISREKLEPEPGFEPRTSGFPARRSATQEEDLNMNWHESQDGSSGRAPGWKSGGPRLESRFWFKFFP